MPRSQLARYLPNIAGQTGVIERRRPQLGAAAVAHVHANDIASGCPCERRDSAHISGIGRSFETMEKQDGQPFGAYRLRLPVAMAEHTASVGLVYFDGGCFRRHCK